VLRVEQAVVRFGDRNVVDHVDLDVGAHESVAVLGPSGCGKTTLLRAIAGLQPLEGGAVTWDGDDLRAVPVHERRFGLMFQEYALFPHRDVRGNVEFGLRMHGVDGAARAARVDEVLDLVGLRELRDRRVSTLSGGEQQRVALARALAVEPRLLMLDEPLGALDRAWRVQLLGDLRRLLKAAELPALYVTHDHDEAFVIAARIVVMRRGRVVQAGTPAAVWRRPADPWVAAFLGFGAAVTAEARGGEVHTPWGVLPAAVDDGPAQVVVRPDAWRVDPDGAITGEVVEATFAGERVELVVAVEGAPAVVVGVREAHAPRVSDRIRLAVDADGILVYGPD
jgi:thiamine transport system ATP-binding protein